MSNCEKQCETLLVGGIGLLLGYLMSRPQSNWVDAVQSTWDDVRFDLEEYRQVYQYGQIADAYIRFN